MTKRPTDLTEAQIQELQQPPTKGDATQAVTDPVSLSFIFDGRQRLTAAWLALRSLREWADAYEQRGGWEKFGDDATAIVYFNNDLQAIIDATKQATIARLRTDI